MITDTIWDMALVCITGAFVGLVIGQILPGRELVLFCILVGMIVGLCLLTAYYAYLAYKEWKIEQKKKNKNMRRGGYCR